MATNGEAGWFRRLFSRAKAVPLDPTRIDLVVVAESFEHAESCSNALDRGARDNGWVPVSEAVLRHHLVLPPDTVEDAASIAAQDGYAQVPGSITRGSSVVTGYQMEVPDGVPVILQRVQVVDALHCSQERSRMAGLAQRRGGTVLGWDVMQPASDVTDDAG